MSVASQQRGIYTSQACLKVGGFDVNLSSKRRHDHIMFLPKHRFQNLSYSIEMQTHIYTTNIRAEISL